MAKQWLQNALLDWIDLRRPIPIQLDITNACNLACAHCYHSNHSNSGAIGLRNWIDVLDEYAVLIGKLRGTPHIIFCGGEPTLSPNLVPLLNHAHGIWGSDLSAVIITNATRVERLASLSGFSNENLSFQVSLDGPTAALHDLHRGAGNFEVSLKGIRWLVGAGFKVRILAVLSVINAGHIQQFFELAKLLKVSEMNFTRFISLGAGKEFSLNDVSRPLKPMELKGAMLEIMKWSAELNVKTKIQSPLASLIHPDLGRSGRYWEGVVVDHQGRYLASSRSRIVLGDIKDNSMEDMMVGNPYSMAIRKGAVDVCGDCELFSSCGGDRNAAYAETGNYLGPDPGCWKNSKSI
jgi:MoaA/NifB/PqqE/SkfB family radical SAM enzyme